MEHLPSRETTGERKEKELNKKGWGKFRTILLAGSILANGGFIGDKVHESMRVQDLEAGGSQSFSVDFGGGPEDGLDLRGKWGEHAEFSLQKGANNHNGY
ncbi:MAG TPA: hypothetical protein VFB43_19335 [Terracidiphilus sp.]|nr:hypothetical protein [Terracidiphilus sp.]